MGPATSAAFFASSTRTEQQHSQEYEAVGILPRALRDLFADLEKKRLLLNGVDPASDGVESNPANNGDNELGIHANKSPIPPRRQTQNTNNEKLPFEYKVKLQFLELYGEEIRDLLTTASSTSQQKIVIRDANGDAEALGATEVQVNNAGEAMICLTRGMLRRVTGATAMNAESSRSHAMMSVIIEQTTRSNNEGEGEAVVEQKSKFNFVDLAGSERSKRTNAKGQRLKEGININKGLLVLGNVISALASGEKGKFVPFRDSKLTRLLRGSLGGNHKTLMIACASPSHKNAEESLNCLRYANRAKNIQNSAVVNVDPHSKLVNALRGQVVALAGELLRIANRGSNGGRVDDKRFPSEMLEVLVKGGKEAQGVMIGEKSKDGGGVPGGAKTPSKTNSDGGTRSIEDLKAELERTQASLKETRRDLLDKTEQVEAVIAERDNLRRSAEATGTPTKVLFSATTPSKAMGMARGESIAEILTTLSDAGDTPVESVRTPSAIVEEAEEAIKDLSLSDDSSNQLAQIAQTRIQELSSELQSMRSALDRSTKALNAKTDDLESTLVEMESLRQKLRDTSDIDEETIHYIVKQITSYDDQRMENFQSDDEEEDSVSVVSSTSSSELDEGKLEKNEELSNFATVMFCTGKFLVDRELFQESISCFETVLEARRELFGWDDPLVGDALHMEGFVRSKMGDYDRALMLLWDALRIRKISSEPLKISATLRLLADLHFSKEENMHAALFYEECARHLKDHDMKDPHLPLVLIDLARTKDRLGEYSDSMNFFEEALALYEHSLANDDDRIASLQYEMGVLAFQMGDRERGEGCFRHFIRIRKSKGSDLDEGVANALFVLGSLHWATKKRDLAHDCWVEALEIFKGLGRNDDDPYVKSLKEKIHRAQRRPISRMFRG